MYRPNLQSVALAVPEIIVGWGCEPPILGMGRPQGIGDGTVRKSVGDFVQPLRSNFSSIFTHFRDIAASVLQHATTPLISPKFPHVPLGVCGWPFGYEEQRCWAKCPCNQFPRFPTYVILIHQRHRQTDGQTDGQMDDMQSQYRTMHQCIAR